MSNGDRGIRGIRGRRRTGRCLWVGQAQAERTRAGCRTGRRPSRLTVPYLSTMFMAIRYANKCRRSRGKAAAKMTGGASEFGRAGFPDAGRGREWARTLWGAGTVRPLGFLITNALATITAVRLDVRGRYEGANLRVWGRKRTGCGNFEPGMRRTTNCPDFIPNSG